MRCDRRRKALLVNGNKLTIALLSTLMFVLAAASLIVLGLGAAIAADTGLESGSTGLLVTAFALPYAVAAPLLQLLVGGRCTPRSIIVGGGLLLGVGLLLTSVAQSVGFLLVARGITAIGAALITPAALAMATALVSPGERGRAIAAVLLGFTLASVIGVPMGVQLAQLLSWQATFALFAVMAFALAALAWWALPSKAPDRAPSWRAIRGLAGDRHVLGALAMVVLHLAAQFMVLAPMAVALTLHFGLADALLPVALLVFGVAGVVGNHLGGQWSDRWPVRTTLRIGLAGLAAALVALSAPLDGASAAATFALLAFFGTLFRPPQTLLLTRLVDDDLRALAMGLNTAAAYVGLALGSAASVAVIGQFGFAALGWSALALVVVTALLVELVTRTVEP